MAKQKKGETLEEFRMRCCEYARQYRAKHRLKLRVYNRQYNKLWRKVHGYRDVKSWRLAHPERARLYDIFHYAVRIGRIKKQPCVICGKKKSQAHHPNYLNPFDVEWLCVLCHRHRHLGQV